MMVAMVAWLRGVLDGDRVAARACLSTNIRASMLGGEEPPPWVFLRSGGLVVSDDRDQIPRASTWPTEGAHIIRHDPRQVLARVKAERAVLDLWEDARLSPHSEAYGALTEAVRALVSGYRHRPGYNPAWSPDTP